VLKDGGGGRGAPLSLRKVLRKNLRNIRIATILKLRTSLRRNLRKYLSKSSNRSLRMLYATRPKSFMNGKVQAGGLDKV